MDTISTLPPGTSHLAAQSQEGLASKGQGRYLAQQWTEAGEAAPLKTDCQPATFRLAASQTG
ncbi:MAG TPA: hypothetical protein VJ810_25855 [Blastocatellia bacterium]|nr:hypothetical protein [Blastocatellia bacterium]